MITFANAKIKSVFVFTVSSDSEKHDERTSCQIFKIKLGMKSNYWQAIIGASEIWGQDEESPYDGVIRSGRVSWLDTDDGIISDVRNAMEHPIKKYDASWIKEHLLSEKNGKRGVLIECEDENGELVKLVSLASPIKMCKHTFLCEAGSFKEITSPILTLPLKIDVIIGNGRLYLLSEAGERFMISKEELSRQTESKVETVVKENLVTSPDVFKRISLTGLNPRRYLRFNGDKLRALQDVKLRRKLAKKFSLPLRDDLFITEDKDVVDGLVRLLCDKGMVDPVSDQPMAVSGAERWTLRK